MRGAPPPPFRQVSTQKKAKFCCSQTVKSNILLSQNAGNAMSDRPRPTLDVQNFPNWGGGGVAPSPRLVYTPIDVKINSAVVDVDSAYYDPGHNCQSLALNHS